jgi:hypothetical protein
MTDEQQLFVALSPLIQEDGTFPHRIVIRDMGDQYVVHTQVVEPGRKAWYHNGDYFPKRDGNTAALEKAWERFEARSRSALRMPRAKPTNDLKDMVCVLSGRIESLLSDEDYDDEKCIRLAMAVLHEHGWHDDAEEIGRRRTTDADVEVRFANDR